MLWSGVKLLYPQFPFYLDEFILGHFYCHKINMSEQSEVWKTLLNASH